MSRLPRWPRPHPDSTTRYELLAIAISVVLAIGVPAVRPAIVLASCSESTKFVQQVAGTNLYYGNRDAIYTYNNVPSCGSGYSDEVQSTFMRLSDDYRSWIETGVQMTSDGKLHYWAEWRSYPNSTVVKTFDSLGYPGIGAYYSFKITDVELGLFALYEASGSNPDTASWTFLVYPDAMPRDVGEDESEESIIGTGPAYDYAVSLETQNRQSGGWGLWTNLQCDQSQNFMAGWYAQKLSNSSWANNQNPPGIC